MNQEDSADLVFEAIEVFINQILYAREVYPIQIFKKRRVYNTPVFISHYPPLNTYLYKVLWTARELLNNNELQRVQIVIYRNEYTILERYTCHINRELKVQNPDDEFLLIFEEQLRSALYKLTERLKVMTKLPRDSKFKVLLQTKQTGFMRLSHNAHYQDFPWLQESSSTESELRELSLLPLASVDVVGFNFQAEF